MNSQSSINWVQIDWNFCRENVAEFGREKFGREMLQKLAKKSSAGNVAEIGRKILQKLAGKRCKNRPENVAKIGRKTLQNSAKKICCKERPGKWYLI